VAALTIVAQTRPFVIGVDYHARTHTYAIIEASTKRQVACEQFPTTSAGISRALAWVGRRTDGDMGVYGLLRVSAHMGPVWPER
jgi:transposase